MACFVPTAAIADQGGGDAPRTSAIKKKAVHAASRARVKSREELSRAITYAGFEVLSTGESVVFLKLRSKPVFTLKDGDFGVSIELQDITLARRADRFLNLPLNDFDTPVRAVSFDEKPESVLMMVDLKTPCVATPRIVATDDGFVLELKFPKLPNPSR